MQQRFSGVVGGEELTTRIPLLCHVVNGAAVAPFSLSNLRLPAAPPWGESPRATTPWHTTLPTVARWAVVQAFLASNPEGLPRFAITDVSSRECFQHWCASLPNPTALAVEALGAMLAERAAAAGAGAAVAGAGA